MVFQTIPEPQILKEVKKQKRIRDIMTNKIPYKVVLIFLGYVISFMPWSHIFLFVATTSLIWLQKLDNTNVKKIKAKVATCSYTKHDLIERFNDMPFWVKFSDKERVEWINQILEKLWPSLNNYVVKIFKKSVVTKIEKKYESVKFNNIDFEETPLKIEVINVHNAVPNRDSIIIDLDVSYDGECDVSISISGTDLGGIRQFQLEGKVRVVLKRLLSQIPPVGGIQMSFLNPPDIRFALSDGLAGIPGLLSYLHAEITEKITRKIVFPNSITKKLSKCISSSELNALEPAGVLRVHVFEAKDLMDKDITGKSDPYAVLYLGAQERKSNVVYQSLNPKWDYWCEFVVIDPISQHLVFEIFDKNNVNRDEFLGSGKVEISTVMEGNRDQWINLRCAKHGSVHLRFTWLNLSLNVDDLEAIRKETQFLQVDTLSKGILIVYVDMAKNLPEAKSPEKPHPYFYLTLGEQKVTSKTKKNTIDPAWQQSFVLLVSQPFQDLLQMTVMDKSSKTLLTQFSYKIADLLEKSNLETKNEEFKMENDESTVIMSLQLRIITNKQFEMENEDEEIDSDSDVSLTENIDNRTANSDSSIIKSDSFKNLPQREIEEEVDTNSTTPLHTSNPTKTLSDSLCRLEVSLHYNELRQILLVTIHQISNLSLKDPSNVPNPYVRVKIFGNKGNKSPIYRTQVIKNNYNPVFEETFEYLFSKTNLNKLLLVAIVKTKNFLHSNTIGQVEINLKDVNLSEPYRAWFDLKLKSS